MIAPLAPSVIVMLPEFVFEFVTNLRSYAPLEDICPTSEPPPTTT